MVTVTLHNYRTGELRREFFLTRVAAIKAQKEVVESWEADEFQIFRLEGKENSVFAYSDEGKTFWSVSID